MKTVKLLTAAFTLAVSTASFAGDLTRSFTIDDSDQSLQDNANGYFEFDPSAFRVSNIAHNGIEETYHVGNPAYQDLAPGDATYYINNPQADHSYKFSYTFFGWPNRAEDQKFTVHKLDGTTTEIYANLLRADKALDTITLEGEYMGVSHITISNVASNQGTENVGNSGYGTGWVIADNLHVKEFAPDTPPAGGQTPALCPVYDYDIDWSGLVESAEGTRTGYSTYSDVIGDVNKDGIEDRIVSDRNGTRVHFMNADLTFVEGPHITSTKHTFARKAGDFSKDGTPDIMLGWNGKISMIALNEDGSVKKRTDLSPWQNGLEITFDSGSYWGYDAVAAADTDGDGFTDTYLATVPGHTETTGSYDYKGLLMFQVNETGAIPVSPNKLKWISIDHIGGNFETIDLRSVSSNGILNLVLGWKREVQNNIVSGELRYVTLSPSFTVVSNNNVRIYDKIITHHYPGTNTSKIGYFADGVEIPGYGYFVPTYNPATLVVPGGSNLNAIIARGINNMPPLDDGNMSMRATSVSLFVNFAGTGKTILNVGGYEGVYTITLDATQL